MTKKKESWIQKHSYQIRVMISQSTARYTSDLAYGILPVLIAFHYGEWFAGLFFGVLNLIQAYLGHPIAGNTADRIGSKPTMLIGLGSMLTSALIWIFLPMNNIFVIIIFGLFFFISYSFRQTDEIYFLRMSSKKEGGAVFGLSESFYCLARFFSTISIPFFILSGNQYMAAWIMLAGVAINFYGVASVPNDPIKNSSLKSFGASMNPLIAIKGGWSFVKKNKGYPLMILSNNLFEGFFYGTIWFVFPLHIAAMNSVGFLNGLTLGIYEVVFAITAFYFGYLADRYNWRFFHSFGWIIIALGIIALPIFEDPIWLIIVGVVIALGNSLSNFAADHAFTQYDIDHREDGAFVAMKNIVNDTGYALAPLIAGFLYFAYGFKVSLYATMILSVLITIWMVWLTWKTEKEELKPKRSKEIKKGAI